MTKFTKDSFTHPANGPLTEERLISVHEWLQSLLAYSDDSNRDYMMADAAKAIEELLAMRKAGQEPYGYVHKEVYESEGSCGLSSDHEAHRDSRTHIPLYAAPQLPRPAVEEEILKRIEHEANHVTAWHHIDEHSCKVNRRDLLTLVNACRTAMLKGVEQATLRKEDENELPTDCDHSYAFINMESKTLECGRCGTNVPWPDGFDPSVVRK